MPCFLVMVHFHDGRYHGHPDWPPSPARLFQALVAGAADGNGLAEADRQALSWLELQCPPAIAAPPMRVGQSFRSFVPNNDLDAVGGSLARIGEIRTPKQIQPCLFDQQIPLLYLWTFEESPAADQHAMRVTEIASLLYQLGRGIDMAWASGSLLSIASAREHLSAHLGPIFEPGKGGGPSELAVPCKGSLESLLLRHAATRTRLQKTARPGSGRRSSSSASDVFVKPPEPHFTRASYRCPALHQVYDLLPQLDPWRLDRIVKLTELIRDEAALRLARAIPAERARIEKIMIGHRASTEADKAMRVRITPLPSIGHPFADRGIRRILVEIPPNCPLRRDDLAWAFSGTAISTNEGEVVSELAPATDLAMLRHYNIGNDASGLVWRTVTPAALPHDAGRRRIDPARRLLEAKAGRERATEEARTCAAAHASLRHAGITTRVTALRVQREPFEANGARAEAFAPQTRFAKEQLWHVEITFAERMRGPLVIGDGRYLGLGLMAPARDSWRETFVYSMQHAGIAMSDREELVSAIRRALMAISRDDDDGRTPPLFSGHKHDSGPARSGRHQHVFLACADHDRDGIIDELLIAAPWTCDRSTVRNRAEAWTFERFTASLQIVRAGRLGVVELGPPLTESRLSATSTTWTSHSRYQPTRHLKRCQDPAVFLCADAIEECMRRGLPRPEAEILDHSVGPKGGLSGCLRLRFAVAVSGPILLGRDSHRGGGLFEPVP